jgi:ribosomal protein L7/L12
VITEQQYIDLRNRIIRLEGQVAFLYEHLGMTFVPEEQLTDDPKIVAALTKGNLLEAIRVYREITGATVEESRKAVEEIQGRLGL